MSEERVSACHSVWSDFAGVVFSRGYLDAGGVRTRYMASGDPTMPLALALGWGGYACLDAFGPWRASTRYYRDIPEWMAGYAIAQADPLAQQSVN